MASLQIKLSLESGDFDSGFSVSLQCFDSQQKLRLVARGQLPAQPELRRAYQVWKDAYLKWGGASRLDPILNEPANVSFLEHVQEASAALELAMDVWLESDVFQPLRQKLYQELSPHQTSVLIVQTQHLSILRLPWSKWRLFEAFPLTQLLLAPDSYRTIPVQYSRGAEQQVKLLAVLANDSSIDTHGDQKVLEGLPQTQLTVLDTPTRKRMTDSLWTGPWDIFFFAGHSSSQTGHGQFTLAQEQWIAPTEMKFGLQKAARQGLKLAIFNSCDGLAIAQDLVQNDVPFIITMREPVPDNVAQAFLSYFLAAYSGGQSLYQSFQEASKRLESIEDQSPCATWLPVLMCNPTVVPPAWKDFIGKSEVGVVPAPIPLKARFRHVFGRTNGLLFWGLMMLLLVLRGGGGLQGLELWAFDQLMQLRPQEIQDSRILVVEIDEAILQDQASPQGSISDQRLNQAIQALSRHQPRVIGIDIYRDHLNLDPDLKNTFQTQTQVIGVCKSPDPGQDDYGVAGPTGISDRRLGFSDILEDADGVVRRQLLFMGLSPTKTCATPWSFSSQLALHYLKGEKVVPHFSKHSKAQDRYLMLRDRAFYPIRQFWGGYQQINLGGNQILLNYRAVPSLCKIAPKVSLDQVLNDQVPESQIRNRLVMIGVTANTTADFWETPYQSAKDHRIPGVFLQAHMTSQVISAVLDKRPLLQVLPHWAELLIILLFGGVGTLLPKQNRLRWLISAALYLGCVGLSWLALSNGLWLPLIPCLIAFTMMGIVQSKRVQTKRV